MKNTFKLTFCAPSSCNGLVIYTSLTGLAFAGAVGACLLISFDKVESKFSETSGTDSGVDFRSSEFSKYCLKCFLMSLSYSRTIITGEVDAL